VHALGIAARAKGMKEVAARAGVTRANLYRAFSAEGQLAFETVFNVVRSFGLTLAVR
jgi:probable addiction module antidote protein